MSTPLPKSLTVPKTFAASAHAGLWFDKFCNQWSADWTIDSPAKLKWLQTVTGSKIGDEKLLSEHALRLSSLARSNSGEAFYFETASRFATGLGREHPVENGFVWHPLLGTPCLPGSSVKGLVRAWATSWATKTDDHEATLARIFGPRDLHGTPASIGSVIFFDAIPTKPVQLAADVMTPHYGPYYEGKADDKGQIVPPADWHSPVPIPFLTVAAGQSFLFSLAPRLPADKADCQQAAIWLETALCELGAGAKTAVGYGRFEKYDPAKESETSASAITSKTQRYRAGQRVRVRRTEDPKGKGRVWFEADDGFGGVVTGGPPPQVEIGETVELEIASVTQGSGYNFRLSRTAPATAQTKNKPQHRR